MSYATVAQYQARYGAVADVAMLQECLDDASAAIDAALARAGIVVSEQPDGYADKLMRVCRSMANRVMPIDGGDIYLQDAKSLQITAGPYSQSYNFGTSYGTPKLTKGEMAMLGISCGYRSIQAHTWADDYDA